LQTVGVEIYGLAIVPHCAPQVLKLVDQIVKQLARLLQRFIQLDQSVASRQISIDFESLTLEESIRKIFHPSNCAILYDESDRIIKVVILGELNKLNLLRRIVIHTICVGDEDKDHPAWKVDPNFLEKIANENHVTASSSLFTGRLLLVDVAGEQNQ